MAHPRPEGGSETWRRHPLAIAVIGAVLGGVATVVAGLIANETNTITIVTGPTPTITATTTATTTVTVTTTSTVAVPSPGTSGYVLQPAVPTFRIGAPDVSCQRTFADLDVPEARVNSDDKDGDDLMYWNCSPIGFQRHNARYLGAAGRTRPPTAEQCAQLARVGGVSGSIEPDDLRLDQAFCLVTDEENVAWMRLTKKEKTSASSHPNLVFQVAVWKRG